MNIKVSKTKEIREELGATHLVIFALDENGEMSVATHGKTRKGAKEASDFGNRLKKELGFPEECCNSTPLQRICYNCAYWKADWGIHCFNGWTGDGSKGYCHCYPEKVAAVKDGTCSLFEPYC